MTTVGSVVNGITAVGVRDNFLSIKWDPVENANSYAIYKEGTFGHFPDLTLIFLSS